MIALPSLRGLAIAEGDELELQRQPCASCGGPAWTWVRLGASLSRNRPRDVRVCWTCAQAMGAMGVLERREN